MRTKKAERVTKFEVMRLEPFPEIYICFDGLGKLCERNILDDVILELRRRGAKVWTDFLDALRRGGPGGTHSARVQVYFHDFVSYGVGGGDATAEFFFNTYLLLHDAAGSTSRSGYVFERETLTLVHPAERPLRVELDPPAGTADPAKGGAAGHEPVVQPAPNAGTSGGG